MASIALKNVSKLFEKDKIIALNEVCLAINDGESLVIVGPSGCGKTTLLRIVAGLDAPTEGTILADERVINKVSPKDRNVAMVFQNYALYPHMTVYQNMAFALKLRKFSKKEIRQRVIDMADLLNIASLLDRRPQDLSGGQRQRVAVGRALVTRPSVFLFDEPMSQLDPQLRHSMRSELRALQKQTGITTIYVTHDQREAAALGDRVAVMCRGAIHQIGTHQEVFDHPVNRFVAGFLGDIPMSFIEGTIGYTGDTPKFMTHEMTVMLPKEWSESVLSCKGKTVVLGVRPHDIRCILPQKQPEQGTEVVVEHIETLGDRSVVRVTTQGALTLTVSSGVRTQLKLGDKVLISLDGQHVHLFQKGRFGRNVIQQALCGKKKEPSFR